MWLINRLMPAFAALGVFALLESALKSPRQIYWLAPVALALTFLSVWQLTGQSLSNKKFWRFLITPLIFLAGSLLFLSFLEGFYWRQFFCLITAVLLGVFLEMIYLWFHRRPKYQPNALENISAHLNLLTVFLLASSAYSLIIFLAFPLWLLLILFALSVLILTYELCWVDNVIFPASWPYLVVITLITLEVFLAVSFLPNSVYISGLIVAVVYYLMTGLARNWFLGVKENKVIKRYLLISLIILLIVLLTAKWF